MRCLVIRTFKTGVEKPKSVIRIPLAVARLAGKLVPRRAAEDLEQKGINIPEILRIIEQEKLEGTLIEIRKGSESTSVSVE